MPTKNAYHMSYYLKNKARLQEYQRQYYYRKKKEEDDPDTADPKQWIKITRGDFVLKFD